MKHNKTATIAALAAVCCAAQASVLNLWWEPATQSASNGQTVAIDVYANTDGPSPLALSDAYLAITWDSSVLTNATPATVTESSPWATSYWAPGAAANTNLQDGDAQRELLGDLPPDNPFAPVGTMRDPVNKIKVTTFWFTVQSLAAPTSVKLWGTTGTATTNFYKGDYQIGQWNLAFEQGAYSEAWIAPVPVPEPATAALVAAAIGMAARRRLRKR